MRLFLLSLVLVLGARAHSIGYRTNLYAYAPARGEFPVSSGLAPGYLRYLDQTGAERLVAFNYPDPLYGIRSEAAAAVKSSPSSPDYLSLFRAWCEQRYNALRVELERVRAEGKQPTPSMLAQYEPLEQIIKQNAFEAVPGLSPEVQRARDEHLRIWNAARLQVLQAEKSPVYQQEQQRIELKSQPATNFAAIETTPVQIQPQTQTQPQAVQETQEVLRAREEHLKRYQEALQQQPTAEQPQAQPVQPAPFAKTNIEPAKPVEETAEVKRAREEHLRQYQEALQRQQQSEEKQPQYQVIAAPLPTAAIKSQLPASNIKVHEQQLQLLNKDKLIAEDKVADIEDKIRYEEREQLAERRREQEQRELEQRQAELERQREAMRLSEEQQLLETERIALQQQEQARLEAEQLEQATLLQSEQPSYKATPAPGKPQPAQSPAQSQPQLITQQQQVQNGFFLRIQAGEAQPAVVGTPIANAESYLLAEHSQNPFLLRYIQHSPQAQAQVKFSNEKAAAAISSTSTSSSASASSNSISELEQATREHFKAHAIALEQLRLANQQQPQVLAVPCGEKHERSFPY
ncbi:CG1850 [Drosophila busckii]|uniref:CG1850 n=1 Tax=Drosophila busckii TaxID=30019 RepID=A0A0M4EDU8_DROBS|nr:putative mediator of RNA polymerase II transcription subunit 26 [Drosophila busckii]ALC41226.1 CG1850 [Drosophila busckii]